MRIRFLLHDLYSKGGGVLTVTLALAEELAQRHHVELVSVFADEGRDPVHALPDGVGVRSLMPRRPEPSSRSGLWVEPSALVPRTEPRFEEYSLESDRLLAAYLDDLRGGFLVTMQPALTAAAMQLPSRAVKVAQEHRPFRGRPTELLELYREHVGQLDAFLTLTRDEARAYRSWLGTEVPVRAIPNGLPVGERRLSSCEPRVVVAAGRLQRSKGFDILVDAWAHVAEKEPDWSLRIFGEGELEGELREQIRRRGLEQQVRLMGFSSQLREELLAGSTFVLSSRSEGYPRVILEAMACGLPVVSTACPAGPREMIEPSVDGLLVPNRDADALGEALTHMIEVGAERRRAMGAAGRLRVESSDQAVVAATWERLLRKLRRARRKGKRTRSRA